MKIERILDWCKKNHKDDPKKSIYITAEMLYKILRDVCRKQFELDKKQFNEILEEALSDSSGEVHQA